jgi:arginine deiminase
MKSTGCISEYSELTRVLLKHPVAAFCDPGRIAQEWKDLGFLGAPDLEKARDEYEQFVCLLKEAGAETCFLPSDDQTGLDSIYVRDAALVTQKGVILCNMGKVPRKQEPSALQQYFAEQDIPILGCIQGDGTLEGGDVVILDETTIVVGHGYRTSGEGIRQLRQITEDFAEVIVVPLPHWNGPDELIHLMSLISPVDRDLAVVYSRLMPVSFREELLRRGITLIEVSDTEYQSMGSNVLAIAPRKCILLAGNPQTKARLEAAGAEVLEFVGEDICIKGGGGPTCLTRPLVRKNDYILHQM